MRKREMSDAQLNEREQFIAQLAKAGWAETVRNRLFEDGDYVPEEAQMEYEGRSMRLTLESAAEQNAIVLHIEDPEGHDATFVVECGEKLRVVLKVIDSFKSSITANNFRQKIKELVKVCPETYAMTPEGLKQLVDG